jgi:chromosome segregation ATPase
MSTNETQEEIESLVKALNRLDGDIKLLEEKLNAKDKQHAEACTRADNAEREIERLQAQLTALQKQTTSPSSVIDPTLDEIKARQSTRLQRRKTTPVLAPTDNRGDFEMLELQIDSELDVLKKQIDLY